MTEITPEVGSTFALPKPAFDQLMSSLRAMGYETIAPNVQQDVISSQYPYKALLVRAIELVEVYAEAIRLAKNYAPQGPCHVPITPCECEGAAASEAPRGLLYHRYVVNGDGFILAAKIVPPTAQNLARIEADLGKLVPQLLELNQNEATLMSEHLVRSYDPCISCATHISQLRVENL